MTARQKVRCQLCSGLIYLGTSREQANHRISWTKINKMYPSEHLNVFHRACFLGHELQSRWSIKNYPYGTFTVKTFLISPYSWPLYLALHEDPLLETLVKKGVWIILVISLLCVRIRKFQELLFKKCCKHEQYYAITIHWRRLLRMITIGWWSTDEHEKWLWVVHVARINASLVMWDNLKTKEQKLHSIQTVSDLTHW